MTGYDGRAVNGDEVDEGIVTLPDWLVQRLENLISDVRNGEQFSHGEIANAAAEIRRYVKEELGK